MKTRNMIPISWTSPPKRRQANAWPHSWMNLMPTKTAHSHSQLPGAIEFAAADFTSSQRGVSARHAARIIKHQTTAPPLLSIGPTSGIQRLRNRSGSQMGMRGNRTFISRPCIFRFICCLWRRSRTIASADTSVSIKFAEWSWLRIWMTSGCVGASSASCPPTSSHASPTVRDPSSKPTNRYAASDNRWN
jgi:hypothetical protein